MKQGTEKNAVRERARAAARIAKLRREAEERQEAEAKLKAGEAITKNDLLAMMGSGLRVPEDVPTVADYVEAAHLAEAAKRLAEEPTSTPTRRKRGGSYNFTAEDITKLRDEQGLSWRQVAVNLDLGSPSGARAAYTALTGRHHSESGTVVRRARGGSIGTAKTNTRKVFAPEWNDESDQDEIIERLQGSRIVLTRYVRGVSVGEEEVLVGKVRRLTWDGPEQHLCVHFIDRESGGMRSALVSTIKEVR